MVAPVNNSPAQNTPYFPAYDPSTLSPSKTGQPGDPSPSGNADMAGQGFDQTYSLFGQLFTLLLGPEKAKELVDNIRNFINGTPWPSLAPTTPPGTPTTSPGTPTTPPGTPTTPPQRTPLEDKTFQSSNVLHDDQQLWTRDYAKDRYGLSYDELDKVINDTGLSQGTRDAAKHLKENKAEFDKIDKSGAWVGDQSDGIISRGQLKAFSKGTDMFAVSDHQDKHYSGTLNDPANGVSGRPRTPEEFKKMAQDPNLNENVRISAQYFVSNPNQIDKAFGSQQSAGSPPAGTGPSRTERTHNLPILGDPNDANTQKAGKQLLEDPKVEPGTLSKEDLQGIANDDRHSEETRKSAQYLVDNPGEFSRLDRGSGNTPDDFITKSEIRGYFINDSSVPNNVYRASSTLTNDPEVPSGLLSNEDLRKIVGNKDYDQKTRDAAQFFLDNPTAYKQADGDANGYLSKEEMGKFLGSTDKPVTAPATPENTRTALTALQNHSGLQKPFAMADLKDIAADETQSPEVRKQAQYFIDHPEEFHKVDKASAGSTDGSITAEDMTKYLAQNSTDAQAQSNASTLLNDPKLKDLVDKGMSLDDLDKISKDTQYDPPTRNAAKFFVDNPNSFDTVSGTASDGKADQNISRKDLEGFVAQRGIISASPEETNKQISQLINDPVVAFPLTEAELHKIADDTGDKYSAETKKAAHYFLDNKAEFDVVDGQDGTKNGSISKEEALKAMTAGMPANEENTKNMGDRLFYDPQVKLPVKYEDLEGIMNDQNHEPGTREAARYFHEHKEEFDKVISTRTGFAPIDGLSVIPKSEANDNASIDALVSAYLNGKLYGKDGKLISFDQPLLREDMQGIATNSQNSKEVREAAYYFYQNDGGIENVQSVQTMQKHVENRDIQGEAWTGRPDWLKGRAARLHEHMQEKHLSSLNQHDLTKIYADPKQDIELRRAAEHLYGLMEGHPDYYGDALSEHGLWRMSQGKSYNK